MATTTLIREESGGTVHRLRSIISGSIGNMVEYYDWYVYSAFAIYFAKSFFPSGNQTAELLNVAAIFAVGFIMRPIGGWVMGLYADRAGRKASLMVSVLAMCFGSFAIALTPSYATIGIAAPIILVLARLLQGLSLGGEYSSSATYLSEMAPPHQRGFYASFIFATLSIGQLLALGVLVVLQQFFLTTAQLESWGWRIPFVIGACAAVVAIYLRRGMEETESFSHHKADAAKKNPMRELLVHWRACLTTVGLTLGGTVSFYAFTTYIQKYLVNTVGMPKDTASNIAAGALVIFIILQPILGSLSDRIGRRPLMLAFGLLGAIFTVPIFTSLSGAQSAWHAFWLIVAALSIVSLYSSVSAIVKAELFPVHIRALGVGLPYSLTVALAGGTAEFLALWFKSIGHETWFYWYVAACMFISFITFLIVKDPKQTSWIDRD